MSADGPRPLAAVRIHPALIIFGALILGGLGGDVRLRGEALASETSSFGGWLIAAGLVVLVFAYGAMALARTTINPRRPTRTIVTRGIYRFSRNPIYVGWFLVLLGRGFATSSFFRIALAVLAIGLLHWAVVLPEEAYLERAFGDEYLRYKEHVRRWL